MIEKIRKKFEKWFGASRGFGKNYGYMYTLLYHANKQGFIDNLRKEDLEVLKQAARENMPETCDRCWFFQAYSTPPSCTMRCENPSWDGVPEDCPLKQ